MAMRLFKPAFLLFLLLVTAQQGVAGNFSQYSTSRQVTVSYVYDGDTFKTDRGEKVRLLAINTPEIAHNDSPGEALGPEASSHLKSLIQGKQVQLAFDEDKKDNYGRTLAHVFLRDGTWINAKMVEDGMAHLYLFAPNFRHADELLKLEQHARKQRLGIWKTERFREIAAEDCDASHAGQFRIVTGAATSAERNGWGFNMGSLSVSVPKAYRKWFKSPLALSGGTGVAVRGTLRLSRGGKLYLAIHSPYDLEINEP